MFSQESEESDKLIEMMKSSKMLGRRILGLKCVGDHIRDNDGSVLVYKLDTRLDRSNWVEVHCVSKDNRILTPAIFNKLSQEGHVMMKFLEGGQGMHGLGHDVWLADECLMEDGLMACCVWINP